MFGELNSILDPAMRRCDLFNNQRMSPETIFIGKQLSCNLISEGPMTICPHDRRISKFNACWHVRPRRNFNQHVSSFSAAGVHDIHEESGKTKRYFAQCGA